jgi:glycosyltransferase involved in cell wall biosynthesis
MLRLAFSIADQNVMRTKSIGIFNCALNLASRLARDPEIQLTVIGGNALRSYLDIPNDVNFREYNWVNKIKLGRIFWDQWNAYSVAKRGGNDWLFLPKGFASFVRRPPIRVAAYVHDTMLEFYREKYPRFFPSLERVYFAASLRATLRNASVIFTNTDFSGEEIKRLATQNGLFAPLIITAGYGFSTVPSPPEARSERLAIIVSRWPHKRADLAVDYTERWRQTTGYNGIIDCVGELPDGIERPASPNWQWHGRLRPDAARAMMRGARVVVYFSEYEGFGMPPVEATLDGACPVYSDLPPTREVMRGAGFDFENSSYQSFAEAMNAAMRTPPEQVEVWARELLARHNWDNVAKRVIEALTKASRERSEVVSTTSASINVTSGTK